MTDLSLSSQAQVYQIKDGHYVFAIKNKQDDRLAMARSKNKILFSVTCNELLDNNRSNSKIKTKVYHPIQILPPIFLQQKTKIKQSQSFSLFKSIITAETDRKNSFISNNSKERRTKNYSQLSSKTQQKPSIIEQFPRQSEVWNFSLKPHEQKQNLKESRLMKLEKSRANDSRIKTYQVPMGYEYVAKQSRALDYGSETNTNEIQLPPPFEERQVLKYKKKLVTLFELKNSQSQDDLCVSFHSQDNEESFHLNFGKVVESKIMRQSEIKKSQSKIQKSSIIYHSVIEVKDQDQSDSVHNSDPQTHRNDQLRQINKRNLAFNQQNTQLDVKDIGVKPKNIRGLKKCGKFVQKRITQEIDKKIQTPKFGKNFSFKQ